MRLFALLPLLVAAPTLLSSSGTDFDRPSAIEGLPSWYFGNVLGAARWQWLALALLLAFSGPVSRLVRLVLNRIIETRYGFLKELRDSAHGKGIQRSAGLLVSALLWAVALPYLELPDKLHVSTRFLVQAASIVGLVWLVYSIWDSVCDVLTVRSSAMGRRTEKLLVPITRKLVQALIVIGGILLAFASFGVNVTAVVAGLGVGGLIIALAAKDSVENIFGSFTILFDMPFAIGDWVKIGAVEGSVEEINLRSTRIRTSEDSIVTLPNSNLIRASVENLGARRHHRVKTILSVSAQLSTQRIDALAERIRLVIEEHPKTRKTGYQVEVYDFTYTEVRIMINFFVNADSYSEELRYRGELLLQIKRAAEEMGIESLTAPAPISDEGQSDSEVASERAEPDNE